LDGNDKAGPDLGLGRYCILSTIDGSTQSQTQELQMKKVADAVYGPDRQLYLQCTPSPRLGVLKHQQGVRRRCRDSCGY
jgi:hypothetical protein